MHTSNSENSPHPSQTILHEQSATPNDNSLIEPLLTWASHLLNCVDLNAQHSTIVRGTISAPGIVRLTTPAGSFYVKTVPHFLDYEPRLYAYLYQLFPQYLPAVIALEDHKHWLLMVDTKGTPLVDRPEIPLFHDALRAFADIQIATSNPSRVSELLGLGCPDWRLTLLQGSLDKFFHQLSALTTQQWWGSLRTRTTISHLSERLRLLCRELEHCSIPESLVHGDFNGNNISATNTGPVYLDWAEGYIGFPFFVLADFLSHVALVRPDAKEHLAALKLTYLNAWSRYHALPTLLNIFQAAQPIAILRHALRQIEVATLLGDTSIQAKHLPKVLRSLTRHMAECTSVLSLT
jgi:hypothetical protein